MGRKRESRSGRASGLVMPRPRRTTQRRRQKSRMVWVTIFLVLVAIGFLGYGELAGPLDTIEFSGP